MISTKKIINILTHISNRSYISREWRPLYTRSFPIMTQHLDKLCEKNVSLLRIFLEEYQINRYTIGRRSF